MHYISIVWCVCATTRRAPVRPRYQKAPVGSQDPRRECWLRGRGTPIRQPGALVPTSSSQVLQRAFRAVVGVAEGFQVVAEGVGDREEKAVVGLAFVIDRAAHAKAEAAADQDKRDVVERVGVAFAELVRPDDRGVVEQRAGPARLRGLVEALGQVGNLFAVP